MNHRTPTLLVTLAATAVALPSLMAGGSLVPLSSQYPIGVEGIKGGTLPPPGLYLRDYNIYYSAAATIGPHGDKVKDDFHATVYANAIRPVYISEWKILGGYYGADVLVPFIYTDLKLPKPLFQGVGYKGSAFGLGDVFFEPMTVSWHWKQFDLGVGYGFWAPTGEFDLTRPDKPGSGYWSHMLTLGGTWYPVEDKSISVSVLNRYEIHHENTKLDITPGDTYSMEWGISKSLTKEIEVGVAGYYQQQMNDDTGRGAFFDSTRESHDRVLGIGPEVSMFCSRLKTFFSLRYAYEFAAVDRSEGHRVNLTLTRRF